MSLLKPSDLFPTENRFARFLAHPLTGLASLATTAAFFAYLLARPSLSVDLWMWFALAAFPGVWLLFAGIHFMMLVLTFGLHAPGSKPLSVLFPHVEKTWRAVLFRREAFAFVMMFSVFPVAMTWHMDRPYDNDDFQQCVWKLGTSGLTSLAKTLPAVATRNELLHHCGTAREADRAAAPKMPKSLEELQQRYKQ